MAISLLIVDNDEIARDILAALLRYSLPNTIIHITPRFELALELCLRLKVDIVVTSTTLPPKSSDDMIDAIRNIKYNPIKIIIMTSSGREDELARLAQIPNTYIIQKPVDMGELLALLKSKIAEIETQRPERSDSTS